MAVIQAAKALHQGALCAVQWRRGLGLPLLQHRPQGLPAIGHLHVVSLQADSGLAQGRIGVLRQQGEQVQLLILMVARGGQVKVTLHIGGGAAGVGTVAVRLNVRQQAREQVQAALHALMAGRQHLKRLLKAHGRAVQAGKRYGGRHGRHCGRAPGPPGHKPYTRTVNCQTPFALPGRCVVQGLLALGLAVGLSACGTLANTPDQPANADAAATPAAASASAAVAAASDASAAQATPFVDDVTRGDQPAFDIDVQTPDRDLRALLQRHNNLQAYRPIADLDAAELERLMALAETDARNLLATEGYFSPRIHITRQARPGQRPLVVMAVEPGPVTRVGQVDVRFEGDLASTADPDAVAQREAIVAGWGLPSGQPFSQSAWDSAKTGALRALMARRYPKGRIAHSLADVDPAASRANLHVRVDSGPPVFLGPAQTEGAQRYPAYLPERLSWLTPGEVYDQKRLIDAQQRLAGSGYYDSAYISIDPDGPPDAAPLTYAVTEARRHKLQLGLGFSTDAGPRMTLEHRDNRFWGGSWRSETQIHLDRKTPRLQLNLVSMPDAGGWQRSAMGRYMREDDGKLATLSQTLRIGQSQTTERYDRSFYLQLDHANVTGAGNAPVPDALLGDGGAVSLNYNWTGRYFDSVTLPTRGYGLGLDAGAGLSLVGRKYPFTRLMGRWLGVLPVGGDGARLWMRAQAGAVLGSSKARLPASYLFRTGGDTTVRGYGLRSIGIPLVYDMTGPGRYMAVASVEYQRPIMQERFKGMLEHVVFVDVGSVANRINDMRAHWAVGTGVRLLTPVGPMQLDVAYGLRTRSLRLHMTVGFVF